jgi:hypothetical protein
MFISFHLLETYIRNPSLFINSLFTLPPRGKHRWQPRSARAYMRVGRWVLPSFYFCQVVLPNCWSPIFLILPKLDRWQVEMPNCWSCSERNKIMYVPFHLLKNLHQESLSILYFFFTLPPRGKQRWQPRPARAYICAWGGEFCQVSIFAKLVSQTVGGQFFLFCQDYMDAKLVCQTVGIALKSDKMTQRRRNMAILAFRGERKRAN